MSENHNHLNHSTWECKYHVVFTPKYRKKALFGHIRQNLGTVFHDLARRLKGIRALAGGLATFVAVCSVGALANVGIANYLFSDHQYIWWLAGLAGIFVGAVWNFAATSVVTWRTL